MDITKYHAKYFANEIMRIREYNNNDKISNALFNAKVDLNPHQVEASLFAFKSPLSKGVILADEVGLGKTIEAGLVICQCFAENKRKIIIVCPSSLRHQWKNELKEKFNIDSIIMETRIFNNETKKGSINPFEQKNKVIILSYNFISNKKEFLKEINWDLVVIDEAHKLRNVYKPNNKIGNNIKWAFKDCKKLLLTATPLQNSLLELYGLVSLIDENIFGDINSFKNKYIRDNDINDLRERLSTCVKRNLRKDLLEYIKYTKRYPITEEFNATDIEMELYNDISRFLEREDSYSIPKSQKSLTILVIRKLLASSTQAILQTLQTIKSRLEKIKNDEKLMDNSIEDLIDDDFYFEIEQDIDCDDELFYQNISEKENQKIDMKLLDEEIDIIDSFINKAKNIKVDAKTKALLKALDIGFKKTKELGGNKKVLIFTENKRTQEYLYKFLNDNGYKDKIVLFNGSNNSVESKKIYNDWLAKNKDYVNNESSKTSNMRQALISYFKDKAEIMIATEAASEGVNMQFCSFIINYDLPWNPQRIEQRIGRCHRYGQKNDVVVINFLNKRNHADVRVYELLKNKLNLFEGVFGASDKILGNIESGIDFEKRILDIYQKCRLPEEIDTAFDELQKSMEDIITDKMDKVRQDIFENFDVDVREKLKTSLDTVKIQVNKYEKMFWNLSKYVLRSYAEFDEKNYILNLKETLMDGVNKGNYILNTKSDNKEREVLVNSNYLCINEPIGEFIINRSILNKTENKSLTFDITNNEDKISVIESLKGNSGYLTLKKLTVDSFEREEHLIFNAIDKNGNVISQEVCEKMFYCNAIESDTIIDESIIQLLEKDAKVHIFSKINEISESNQQFFKEEQKRLIKWEDDMLYSIEEELDKVKSQIRKKEREKLSATSEKEMLDLDNEIMNLVSKRRRLRDDIEDMEDKIKQKRQEMVNKLKRQMDTISNVEDLFTIKWEII